VEEVNESERREAAMSELAKQEQEVGAGYFASHPFLSTAVEILGGEAIAGINAAVGSVHQASSNVISPGFDPQRIYK
jgi:hypothetical protein